MFKWTQTFQQNLLKLIEQVNLKTFVISLLGKSASFYTGSGSFPAPPPPKRLIHGLQDRLSCQLTVESDYMLPIGVCGGAVTGDRGSERHTQKTALINVF